MSQFRDEYDVGFDVGRKSVHDACVDAWKADYYKAAFAAGAASRDAEIAHLKQELQIECASNAIKDTDTAALRADALRYRWLRNHVIFGYPSSEGSSNKAAYLVVTGYGYRESKKLTDQAIDAVRAAEGK